LRDTRGGEGTAPLAEDALQDSAKRVSAILARLKEVGIKESDVRLSGNQFTPAGGGRYVMPGMQRVTGFEIFNVLQVRLPLTEGTAAEAMQSRIAGLLYELIKAGASMLSPDVSRMSLGGNSAAGTRARRWMPPSSGPGRWRSRLRKEWG
jgi:hypothetical protein